MSIGYIIGILAIGMLAGFMSSMVGIGGGIVIVPALVFVFGFSQKLAQGTSLAMLLPPIGILGVLNYHKSGLIDFKIAAILCVSFVLGSYIGSKFVVNLDSMVVKRIFAIFMIVVAVKYLFFDK